MAEDCLLEAVRGLRLAHPELGPKPLLAFAAINAAAVAVFIARPYTWVDGTTARLMW